MSEVIFDEQRPPRHPKTLAEQLLWRARVMQHIAENVHGAQ